MKHLFFICILLCVIQINKASAQSPNAIPYQAVVRNSTGDILANQAVSIRFSIHQSSANGSVLYKETQSGTSNSLGLVNLVIGQGVPVTGTLAVINWGNGAKYLQVEMDINGGNSYVDMGSMQMMSVPYALSAGNLPNGTVLGNTLHWNQPLQKWIADHNLLNDGNIIAIGTNGTDPWKLTVGGKDSTLKIKGSGLLGQYGQLNFGDANYVYLKEDVDDKLLLHANRISLEGNVGIGTINPAARLHVDKDDVVFTAKDTLPIFAADPPVTGAGNRMMWYADKAAFRVGSVLNNNWDKSNIGMQSFATGIDSKASGEASSAFGSYTTALGDNSCAFGYQSNAGGIFSNALGYHAYSNGGNSTSIGLYTVANGYGSTVIGISNDSILAPQTSSHTSTTPLFIIGNGTSSSTRSNAMVVRYNGRVGIGTNANTYQFEVSTNSAAKPSSSSWTVSSDARLKDIDGNYLKGLNDILQLNTIMYHYKKDNARHLPSDEQSYGFIAQEVQKVFPECVKENEDGYLSLDIHPILVSYINAFKQLNEMNEALSQQLQTVQSNNELLQKQYNTISKRLEVLERNQH